MKVHGEWTGIAHVTAGGDVRLFDEIDRLLGLNEHQSYDSLAFNHLAGDGMDIGTTATDGLPWVEVDTADDYELAKELFRGQG